MFGFSLPFFRAFYRKIHVMVSLSHDGMSLLRHIEGCKQMWWNIVHVLHCRHNAYFVDLFVRVSNHVAINMYKAVGDMRVHLHSYHIYVG